MEIRKLKIIADMTVRLTEMRQRECKHLAIENFAPECFAKLLNTLDSQQPKRFNIPSFKDLRMPEPNLKNEVMNQLLDNAVLAQEKLAKALIEAECDPANVAIGYRIWFDESENRICHECFPISRRD